MPFEPGKSGNPGGRQKTKVFNAALSVAINRADGDKTKLARIAEALVEKAASGDVPAINCIADRLDGKPQQDMTVEHSGELTLRSVIVSELNSFFSQTAGRIEDRSDENVVSN